MRNSHLIQVQGYFKIRAIKIYPLHITPVTDLQHYLAKTPDMTVFSLHSGNPITELYLKTGEVIPK